jgi:hypothetical protein
MDAFAPSASIDTSTQDTAAADLLAPIEEPMRVSKASKGDDSTTSTESFVSAKEQDVKDAGETHPVESKADATEVAPQPIGEDVNIAGDTQPDSPKDEALAYPDVQELLVRPDETAEVDVDMEDADAPQSEQSSPEKPLHRKSSFTFSSLPARAPLGAKKSMGHLENHRSSTLGKSFGTKNIDAEDEDEDDVILEKLAQMKEPSKTTTQLLHERINLLGKTKDSRASKSIPASAVSGGIVYPQLQENEFDSQDQNGTTAVNSQVTNGSQPKQPVGDDDDDWIAPAVPAKTAMPTALTSVEAQVQLSPSRPVFHQKSISTTDIPSPRPGSSATLGQQRPFSVIQFTESTTPAGSPAAKKTYEGPLSASKNRLWSALKSAKNIFASSASASAAAKLEAHNNSQLTRQVSVDEPRDTTMFNMPGAMYSEKDLPPSPSRPTSAISHSPSRKTRSSTESDRKQKKDAKMQQKAVDDLAKAREKERQKAAKQQQEEKAKADKAEAKRLEQEQLEAAMAERPVSTDGERDDVPPAPPAKTGGMSLGKLRAPGRLLKPSKETLVSKPVPVSIRVTAQSQRLGLGTGSQASLSKSQHESSASNSLSVKDSSSSLRAVSVQSNRPASAAPSGARVRALEAAARKKEADVKATQKKADQKRELERKRAAKAEEEKRAEEERKAAEQQRVQEAKLAAQRKAAEKQALEARKREQERAEQQKREQERIEQERRERERVEQQRRELEAFRQQEEARKAKEAHDLAEAIRRERAQQMPQHPRGDVGGTLRQLVKSTIPVQQSGIKPVKRIFNPDEDESSQTLQRPALARGPPSYQQTDAKRRRTGEEQEQEPERHSVMAPPKRPSNWRKDTLSKFPHGYTHAPPPAQHHNTMYKKPGQPMHPSQLVQVSNARIPFADNNNPPGASNYAMPQSHQQQQQHHAHDTYNGGYPGHPNNNKFKTPARPAPGFPKSAGQTNPKTPSYLQGDAIELPDIATDSEDEESDDDTRGGPGGGFRAPSWVASPALRELLTQQQLVDPESVFGPIGELKMDEVFKNGKNADRLKRFRDRGSSAMWIESGDAVTSAEKRKDMELRERVARDGGWRYEPGAL